VCTTKTDFSCLPVTFSSVYTTKWAFFLFCCYTFFCVYYHSYYLLLYFFFFGYYHKSLLPTVITVSSVFTSTLSFVIVITYSVLRLVHGLFQSDFFRV
jgi:hypothetical protein